MLYQKYAEKLLKIARKSLTTNNINKCLAALDSYCNLAYKWNQFYVDEEVEKLLLYIENKIKLPYIESSINENVVLFYDGFGLDIRGLMLNYIKALLDLKYNIVYVTEKHAADKQPTLKKLITDKNVSVVYIENIQNYKKKIIQLCKIFAINKPQYAFFYTTPSDVSAAIAFHHVEGKIKRFQINLTDHAFWIGKNAFDVCIEFRQYGADVSKKYRKINADKIRILPFYPYIDYDVEFKGYPFNLNGRQVLFSGGSLYKTNGGNGIYYTMLDCILQRNNNLIFLYAGSGNNTNLNTLIKKYPERVFHIQERSDLYELMCHIDVYLNTYPIGGGLMTQYAAKAGKVPLTLKNEGDTFIDEMLICTENTKIEFDTVENLIDELEKLLYDREYYKNKSIEMRKMLISEEQFSKNLRKIMQDQDTKMVFSDINTEKLQLEYKNNFSKKDCIYAVTGNKKSWLITHFPVEWIIRIKDKLLKIVWKKVN